MSVKWVLQDYATSEIEQSKKTVSDIISKPEDYQNNGLKYGHTIKSNGAGYSLKSW